MDWKLEVVVVPVTDIERARTFYADQVGFHVDHDTRVSEAIRIVQLTPPGSACSIVIGNGLVESVPGSLKGLQLVVADIAAARGQLVERGVRVSEVRHIENGTWLDGPGGPWNSFVFFDDPDGNSWTIQERPAST
jgi:catechol 2,3-dioxygenase-like lactoylglutathione lyase family enzyme